MDTYHAAHWSDLSYSSSSEEEEETRYSSTIWESLKAHLRGQIISYTASKNKALSQRLRDLREAIARLDEKYATDPSSDLHKERQLLQSKLAFYQAS